MFSVVLYSDLVTGACLHEVFIWVVVGVYNTATCHYLRLSGHQLLLGCGWDCEPFWFLFLWNINYIFLLFCWSLTYCLICCSTIPLYLTSPDLHERLHRDLGKRLTKVHSMSSWSTSPNLHIMRHIDHFHGHHTYVG